MKRFFFKGLIFSIPFLMYGAAVLLVDPFNYFASRTALVPNEVKQNTSARINYALWKMIAFQRDFVPNILLGDSRMGGMHETAVEAVSGKPFFNLSLGGGTLPEMCELFDFAAKQAEARSEQLSEVVIGINFSNYNGVLTRNRVPGAWALLDNPLMYASNINVLEAGFRNVVSVIEGRKLAIEKPPMSREAFWKHQIGPVARQLYEYSRYPEEDHQRLSRIADYCRERGIRLAFIILPTHVDLQARIAALGRTAELNRFRRDLAQLAVVYDFNYASDLTRTREDYGDPFHAKGRIMSIVIREVWGNPAQRRYVRIYDRDHLPSNDPVTATDS